MKKSYRLVLLFSLALIICSATIDLSDLFNYSSQTIPAYIAKDNTGGNDITDAGATLGRVLFYDKNLSTDNTIACASCHKQELAFSDQNILSAGVNGVTGRHSMRLINSRFGTEVKFFWDERADSLEMQTTMPIRDHAEMGFSGEDGDPDFNDLLDKLNAIPYYNHLVYAAFGDTTVTESRMQRAMSQFVRSIQSFDSKYDEGIALTGGNPNPPFPNFTAQENQGKQLFTQGIQFEAAAPGSPPTGNRIGGGLGCQGCHRAPEFDIDPNSNNNGVISVALDPLATDITVTRSPSLRDLFSPEGNLNGPMMHDGSKLTFNDVLDHYNNIVANPTVNPNLDIRLTGAPPPGGGPPPAPGPGQNLNMTLAERAAVTAFMQTLSGTDVYTNPRWSDPFDEEGNLTIINSPLPGHECDASSVVEGLNAQANASGTGVALEWDVLTGADLYQVKGRPTGTTAFGGFITANNFKNAGGLTPGTGYEWKVRARCDNDDITAFSPLSSFETSNPDLVLRDMETSDFFGIFPNPVVDQLNISFIVEDGRMATFRIISLEGRVEDMNVFWAETGMNQRQFSVRNLIPGIYIAELQVDEMSYSKPFVVHNE